MKLVIGAGERHKKGWTHHDIRPLPGIDIDCDFWELPDHVKKGSVEEVEITHVLEHFPMKETRKALQLIHSLMTDTATIYIEVPNFSWHAEEILKDPLNQQIVEYAYGGQHNEYDYHYNGFTPEQLAYDLVATGFTVDEIKPLSSIECTARKLVS